MPISTESSFLRAVDRLSNGTGQKVSQATLGLADLVAAIRDAKQGLTSSLTQFTKNMNVMGRVYIEDSIAVDPIGVPLVGSLHQMYISYIMAALNLDSYCMNGRTVRQLYEIVQTEDYHRDPAAVVKDFFYNVALPEYTKRTPEENQQVTFEYFQDWLVGNGKAPQKASLEAASGVYQLDNDAQRLVAGRLLEFELQAPVTQGDKFVAQTPFKAYMYVQLIPYIMNGETIASFLKANYETNLKIRWDKLRTGEINFWHDFVFALDLVKKQAQVIKNDRTGVVAEMMNQNRNKLFRWLAGLLDIMPESHNLANAVMIMDRNTFRQTTNEYHIDFRNTDVRQKFFNKTFTMIICVVDLTYQTVDMFFNGVQNMGQYTFDMINKVGAKGKDNFNLKEIMQAFSQGMTPRF